MDVMNQQPANPKDLLAHAGWLRRLAHHAEALTDRMKHKETYARPTLDCAKNAQPDDRSTAALVDDAMKPRPSA